MGYSEGQVVGMKILIADDEDYTREGLIDSIDWESFGIDEIMQAVNGQEALRIAKWFRPDIVLTDIRMPRTDGIDFATELLANNIDSKIIFMSGYMEVEYLRSAIRLSAVDYIEKPIDLAVLKAALARSVEEIQERLRSRVVQENHKDIQQQTLVSLLCGKESDVMTIEKLAAESAFPLNTSYVCIILQYSGKTQEEESSMGKLLELLESRQGCAVGRYDRDRRQIQAVLSFQKKERYHLGPIFQDILDAFPLAKLGAGIEVDSYKNLYNSYRTAAAAVNCAFYHEEERFFQIDEEIRYRTAIEPGLYGEFLQILSEQPYMLEEWFSSVFGELYKRKYCPKEQVCTFMVSLMTAVYSQFPELYEYIPEVGSEEQLQSFLYDRESLREISDFVGRVLTWIQEHNKQKEGYSRIVQGALDYIMQHYCEANLNVSQIAEYLHFSPAYLNVLFKQEMKVTIKQYLSNYRLERARKMLEKDYDKITEISEKCGYANGNYFAKVFKESTGMTPAEYRKKMS